MRSSLPNETVAAGLLEVTQAAQTALSLSELMEAVAQSLPMLAGCDRCALFLWEAEAEGFRLTYQYPARPNRRLAFPRSGLIRPDAVPLAAQVRASLQPFVVPADELRRLRPLRWVKALKLQSLLIAPLRSGDRLIGALALAHNPSFGPITAHRLSVLDSLGRQLATAIQRVQLFETVQRQVQELTILHAVATAGAEATSEDALIERATQVIGGTLYPQNFGVLLLDHGAGTLHVHPSYRLAASFMETRGVPLGQGIVGQVAATGHPVRVPDVTRNPNYIAADPQTRSELCVPLKIGERILGVINVESIRRDAFTETDERVLTTLAGQLATAIEKLRLFTQIQQREAELSTLLEVARAVSASLEPQAVLLQVATSMARALRMERCGLSSYDPLTRMVRTLAVYDISGQQDTERTNEAFSLADYPATACALEQEAVLVIRADDPAADPAEVELLRVYGDAVVLMMALRAGGQVEGLAELYTRDAGRKFAPDELRLARALADQAGLALSNARFYQAEHEQRELAEALREAGTTLGASLDFDTVLDRLMEQIARVTPYDAGNVMLVEDGYARVARLRGYAQFGPKVAQATANLRLEIATTPNLHHMAETGQPLVIPDTATEPDWIKVEASAHVHSWVGAPIRQQDQVIAFFSLDKVEPNFYRPEHAQRLAIFAGQAALALQNARLFAAQGQRAAELEALRQASLSLTASLSLQPLLEAILETTLKFTGGAQDAHIFLYHPEQGGYLTFGAALRSDGQKGQPWASPRPNGLTYNVARQAQTIVVPDMRQHPLFADAPRDWHGAIIGLPLTIGERVVGVMNIAHPQPHAFPEAEVRVLRLLGDQAAIAIENARLFEAERIAREQAEALREVAGVLSADLDQQRLLRLILEQLARVVRYDSASIMLVEEGQLRLVAQRGFPFGKEPITPARVETLPHIQELIEHCRPVIIPNTAADSRWRPTPGDNNVRCWMGVPLMAQDQVLGLLNLDKAQTGFYTEQDAQLTAAFANQAALALQNARLFEAERRQLRLAQTLQAVGALLTAQMSLSDVFESIFDLLARVIAYDSVSVQMLDEEDHMVLAAGRGFPDLEQARQNVRAVSEQRPAERWLQHRLMVIADTRTDERWVQAPGSDYIRSWVGAALLVRGRLVGILTADSATPNAYDAAAGETVLAFANQAAVAIENARLFDEAQRKTRELAGLYDAALATSSELDTRALLHRLYEQVRQIIAPDTFAVVLYDAEAQEIEVALAIEQGQPLPNLRAPLREGSLSGWVIRTRQPLFISDLQTEALSVEIKHITTPARTWLGVPLIAHDRVIGVVSIQSFRPRAFDEAHLRFLESLAGQVAVALENAQLYAEAHSRAAELGQLYQALADEKHRLELLYHLSQNLTATLDPREVAARALDQICSAFGASRGNVLIIRSDQQQLRLLAAQDTDPDWNEQLERQVERRIGEGVAGWVAAHRTPTIVDDVRHDARWVPMPGVGDRVRSVASLPLVAGDVLLGVLSLQSEKPQNFQVEQLPLLTAAAAAVAVALQNAQLFEGMSQQAREVTAASEILHALNASPDVTAVFPFIAANLKTLTDCERVSLALLDDNRETFVMAAVDQPRPEVPLGLRLPIQATAAASDVLAGEAHLTPDLATEVDFPAERALYQAGHRSRINLPLRVGRQVVGALNLVWSRPNAYRLSNLPLLGQIADALALALEKSRLFNETRQRDAILQALAYAGERLLMPGHLGEVLPEVLARLGRAAKVSRAYIFENHVDAESVLLNSQRYEWTAPGHIPQLHNPRLQNLAYVAGGFGRWAETLGAGQPLHGVVRDFPASERGLLEQRAIRSIAVAPIVSGGVWWGYLGFDDCEQERNWSAAELEALKSTADALGAAFARQRSEIAERDQRALAEALHDTAAALNSTLDFDKVLDRILTNVGKVVPHDAATIMLIEARTARIVRGRDYTDNRLAPNLLDLRLPIREAPNLRRIMETGRSLAISDTQTSPGWLPLPEADWVRSYAGTPIKQKGRLIGFINLYSATPNFFGPAQAERLRSFTDQAGVAIENAQLYDQILQHAESLERRVAERTRALAEVNAELQQLDRLKDQFISNVSHELRTPITNIKLHLSLLDKRGPEVLPRYLPTLQRETERLRGLIEDLLDLSRLQTEAVPLRRAPHSLDELASEVIAAHTARAEAKGLAIKHDLNPESLNAPVDRAQIMQVFNNLLGNAVAYTPPGGQITITSQHEKNGEKAGVAVRFRNTSPIIPPEDLPHLFKRFYRGRTGHDSGEPGTGLGLAICKEIIERHSGEIKVESAEGEGTTFTVWLPLRSGDSGGEKQDDR